MLYFHPIIGEAQIFSYVDEILAALQNLNKLNIFKIQCITGMPHNLALKIQNFFK